MTSTKEQLRLLILSALVCVFAVACSEDDKDPGKTEGKAQSPQGLLRPSVVYGDDNRLDLYQVTNSSVLGLARSTVGVVHNDDLTAQSNGRSELRLSSYSQEYNLCADEPFFEQKSGVFCSGFLVAPNRVITAGHCIESQDDCASISFVFDFAIGQSGGSTPSQFSNDQVYKCKTLLARQENGNGADFAIVEIDRQAVNRSPLALRSSGVIRPGEPLTVIGHPAGLPTKVAGGATVRRVNSDFLVANLDTYGGNSGSAVFNSNTGKVEGILVRGETDFQYRNGCYVSYRCASGGCRGEDVTRIDRARVDQLISESFSTR